MGDCSLLRPVGLRLENFLYESADSDFLKLIDFGFSKIWKPNTTMRLSCGTLAYVAPEAWRLEIGLRLSQKMWELASKS